MFHQGVFTGYDWPTLLTPPPSATFNPINVPVGGVVSMEARIDVSGMFIVQYSINSGPLNTIYNHPWISGAPYTNDINLSPIADRIFIRWNVSLEVSPNVSVDRFPLTNYSSLRQAVFAGYPGPVYKVNINPVSTSGQVINATIRPMIKFRHMGGDPVLINSIVEEPIVTTDVLVRMVGLL